MATTMASLSPPSYEYTAHDASVPSLNVFPTLPYSLEDLEITSADRWSRLIPLSSPSITAVPSSAGGSILVNKKFAGSRLPDRVHLAVISPATSISSHIISSKNISAGCIEGDDSPAPGAVEILEVLEKNGFSMRWGLVVVRAGEKFKVEMLEEGSVLEVTVEDLIDLDHVVNIILDLTEETGRSTCKIRRLLYDFYEMSTVVRAELSPELSQGQPTLRINGQRTPLESARRTIRACLAHSAKLFGFRNTTLSLHCANINGLSVLEQNLLVHELHTFTRERNIPSHITTLPLSDPSSPTRAFAISLCPLPSTALPATPQMPTPPPSPILQPTAADSLPESKVAFDPSIVERRITAACNNLLRSEPEITRLDTVAGDGDCGQTLSSGASAVLELLPSLNLSNLPGALSRIIDALEQKTGGTTGAIYCIFLSALAQELGIRESLEEAAECALETLLQYTKARPGDRTLIDVLVPFVDELRRGVDAALRAAEQGVKDTESMAAGVGRASYLDERQIVGEPDAGAVGLLCVLVGLCGK